MTPKGEGFIVEIVHDKIGQEIKPGDFIAYGSLLGRSAALQIGRVLCPVKVILKPTYYGSDEFRKEYRIKIRSGWNRTIWENGERKGEEWIMHNKSSTIYFPCRMIVLDPEKIPLKIKEQLLQIPIEIV